MDDIVAVAVELESGAKRYFLTWGRIQDKVDEAPLEALVLRHSTRFALGGHPVRASVCWSLQEAASETYFYECFFEMCQEKIPFGKRYSAWVKRMAEAMEQGRKLYYLGVPREQEQGPSSGMIASGSDNFP